MLLQQYQHDETGRTLWHKEGDPVPGKGWTKIKGRTKYVKTKSSTLVKKAMEISSRNPLLMKIASDLLEKQALNAFKAREIAKKVGVIPDPTSQWKWAIRQLRDRKGNPLSGKELRDARVKIGDISNNAFNQLSARVRKLPSHTEISDTISKNGTILPGEGRTGEIRGNKAKLRSTRMDKSAPPSNLQKLLGYDIKYYKSRDIHTHPVERIRVKTTVNSPDLEYRHGYPHREASPSGLASILSFSQGKYHGMGDTSVKALMSLDKIDATTLSNFHTKQMGLGIKHELKNYNSDMSASSGGHQRNIFNILDIGSNTVSATKPGANLKDTKYFNHRPRLVYFNHTPRKAR